MPGGVTQPNPLLDELHLKKQSFRRIAAEVGCIASQFREALARMAAREEALQREIDGRKVNKTLTCPFYLAAFLAHLQVNPHGFQVLNQLFVLLVKPNR
jgi:hypothetical protein